MEDERASPQGEHLPPPAPRGRGARSNPAGRFETREILPEPQAWEEEAPLTLPTTVIPERSRSILTRNDSPDVPFEVSINPYKGCEHGCTYCFARRTHAYLGLSPGLDFETKIFSKPEAPERLREALARPGYRCRPIALGANTDPYQPIEARLRITRGILEVLAGCLHPVSIVTKSHRVLRDLDLLVPMAARRLAAVYLSVTTLDAELARRMEPRAPLPERRLEAMRRLAQAGVPVGVLASPMIPGLNDHELERILQRAHEAGARAAGTILLRLPDEVQRVFVEWLEAQYPERAPRVLSRLREAHGGRLYDASFGHRMAGRGPYAQMLQRRFEVACRRLGLNADARFELDTSQFRPPGQLPLF